MKGTVMKNKVTNVKKIKKAHFNRVSPDTCAFDFLFSIVDLLYNHH